jgi:hypothetical protein
MGCWKERFEDWRDYQCQRMAKVGSGYGLVINPHRMENQIMENITWGCSMVVSICEKCGGEAKIIASIEDQAVIDKILHHKLGQSVRRAKSARDWR